MLATSLMRRALAARKNVQVRGYCGASEVKVPIDLIKTLRTKTKAGISDCRNALAEAGLDLEKAESILMKKAKSVADKKSSRLAAEGLLGAVTDVQNRKVAVVELLCETDFASRSPSFGKAVVTLAQKALDEDLVSQEALQSAAGVKDQLEQLIFTLRENITIRRVHVSQSDLMGIYMHQRVESEMGIKADPAVNGKLFLGTKLQVVDFDVAAENVEQAVQISQPIIDKLAVHILSNNPTAIDKATAPQGTDPEDILMDQEFGLVDPSKNVAQVLADLQKKLAKRGGAQIALRNMHRFICGEGIEKKSGENFGDEVAALLKKE
jgi:elongation factor Ts